MDLQQRQDEGGFKFYHYDPSVAGAVIFIILFLGSTLVHGWQTFWTRCWFEIPMVVGGVCKSPTYIQENEDFDLLTEFTVEVIGYIGRAMSGKESPDWTLGPYILQAIFVLVAPVGSTGQSISSGMLGF